MALSDLKIKNAKPKDKEYKLFDGDGLYALVRPNASKLWRLKYSYLGKERLLAIGKYPDVSLSQARETRANARKLLSQGIDPSKHKQDQIASARENEENTFNVVVDEYLTKIKKKGFVERTIKKNTWILKDLVGPFLGHMPIADIQPKHVLEALQSIEDQGFIETAHRARSLISNVFSIAELTGRASTDPTRPTRGHLKKKVETPRPSVTVEEKYAELLAKVNAYGGYPSIRAGLLFLAHTFVRPGELRFADWSEIDLEDNIWRIPEERMKMRRPHDVPLTKHTRAILKEMALLKGRTGLIFPSATSTKKPLSENTFNKALAIMNYKGRMTAHGFRASASTILNERKYRKDVVEMQLAHLDSDKVRRVYNRALYWDERVVMMNDWSNLVDKWRQQTIKPIA
ncbi:hypothetical protein BR10RB9215_C12108 [Brucella sp. 10RB9215]|uniref:tyrosine-type recombinase/integrase n=1 Tax=Brucella sp. 10RB9215 TaxID=1149953 RepID=UPI00090A89A0|nr:integrase arm-type DNA-binding domain-containing protein [Brucella sp. 10RB9215]SBW15259.1 hypothetical protein BR10RB9215_C12108 [Brucella sp. 10RB9215]